MQHLSLTAVDYVALIVILLSALYAMFRGLVHETFAIINWIVAGYAALRLTPLVVPLTRPYLTIEWLQWVVAGLGMFLVIFIPCSIITRHVAKLVKKSRVGAVDRVMGFVFGAGRGLVIVSLAYLAFTSLVPEQNHPDVLVKARLYPVIRDTSQVLKSLMPGENAKKDHRTA